MKLSVIFLTEYLNYASYNSSKHLSSSIIFPIRLRVPDNFIMDVNLTRGNYQSVIISLDNKYIIKNQSFLLSGVDISGPYTGGTVELGFYVRLRLSNAVSKYPGKRSLEALIRDTLENTISSPEFYGVNFFKSGRYEYVNSERKRLIGRKDFYNVSIDERRLLRCYSGIDYDVHKLLSYLEPY